MNRKIKFRGMSVNGWIYGYYLVMQDDLGNIYENEEMMKNG